ncbi:lytic murein transglycosylase [Rhizobiaceae bacterium]|nr:lytic murein transglycosylase [Rhizobiaceae bacterium]
MSDRNMRFGLVAAAFALSSAFVGSGHAQTFDATVAGMKPDAMARGITEATFASATRGLSEDPSIAKLTRKQPELVKPIGGYITRRTSGDLLKRGLAKVKAERRTLAKLGRDTGVDEYVVAAIWGMETGYGAGIGNSDVFRVLATLAHQKYRGDFFRTEFIDALEVMQKEKVPRARMIGSWAGAMGQTQFIPSSFLEFAVDFDGDGLRDPWRSVGDALGSTANYLAKKGWIAGQPWGHAVRLPAGMAREATTKMWRDWAAAGVKAHDGAAFPKDGAATMFFPAGHEGPAFLITENYDVIRDYNSSDAYALSGALLADRLRGGKVFTANWPTDATVNRAQRLAVQAALRKRGHTLSNDTGRITRDVRRAIATEQRKMGVLADGYPDPELLRQLTR